VIEDYLKGSVSQSQERVRQLSQIVQEQYPREYDGLRQICLSRLDSISQAYDQLDQESVIDTDLQTPRRIRQMKRINEELILTESVGVFALSRARDDDDFLNRLITNICRDIGYPLIFPTVSQMSQGYFHIYPDFNLLCMPLIEGRFLLHLPDIYHELCHPFRHERHLQLPRLSPFHEAFEGRLFAAVEYFKECAVEADRLRSPAGRLFQLQLWQTCWVKYWMEEMFCDLFGVMTVGSAYGWSHFHLCVERGGDPFETPMSLSSSHPADAARMKAILHMLSMLGFDSDAGRIAMAWKEFEEMTGATPSPEYRLCYADRLLKGIVTAAHDGIAKIGVNIAASASMKATVSLLNDAWSRFWREPVGYVEWESSTVDALRANFGTSRS
jgi:hypothetical protein